MLLAQLVKDVIDNPMIGLSVPPLVKADRCDRCNGQAMFRVLFPSELCLDFCRHHYLAHSEAIQSQYGIVARISEDMEDLK